MKNKPNILMIMADQFRLTTLEGMGDGISTPNIKRIMDKGFVFDQACCASPLCTPSRAALATGKLPHRCGVLVHDTVLPLDMPTYYQALRKAGYRVGIVGKSDLHKADKYNGPCGNLPVMYHLGFTDPYEIEGKVQCSRIVTKENGEQQILGPYQKYLHDRGIQQLLTDDYEKRRGLPRYYATPSPLPLPEDFQDDFIGRNAVDWLEQVQDDVPWHYMVSFAGPHNPWDPPKEELDKLRDKTYPLSIKDDMNGKPNWVKKCAKRQTDGMSEEDEYNLKRCYEGSVAVIDKWVGNILDVIEKRGLKDNTIIVFCADHGEMLADHGLLEKKCMYEASVRVPLIVSVPWKREREDVHVLAQLMDLAPTFMELAGLDYDKEDMDARSLLPILEGNKDGLRDVQISELINCQMIFDGQYKWIRNWNDKDELYDLQEDKYELNNLIDEKPEVIRRLSKYTFLQ